VDLAEFEKYLRDHNVDSSEASHTLREWWMNGEIAAEDFKRLLPMAWIMTDRPLAGVGTRQWVEMFKSTGFVTDNEWSTPPTEPLTLYRGHGLGRMRGLAWTNNRNIALRFARRHIQSTGQPGFLSAARVPPHAVLAMLANRTESEFVVNPNCLRGAASPQIIEIVSSEDHLSEPIGGG
jgi:hypothetical protein